jgi:NADH-quinone oxidoreductase subunit J
MLVNLERNIKERQFNRMWPVGLVAGCALLALFMAVFAKGKALFPDRTPPMPEVSNTQQIGMMLYGNYMFAFEIASLLLLVAIVGAVIMAKKRI